MNGADLFRSVQFTLCAMNKPLVNKTVPDVKSRVGLHYTYLQQCSSFSLMPVAAFSLNRSVAYLLNIV